MDQIVQFDPLPPQRIMPFEGLLQCTLTDKQCKPIDLH